MKYPIMNLQWCLSKSPLSVTSRTPSDVFSQGLQDITHRHSCTFFCASYDKCNVPSNNAAGFASESHSFIASLFKIDEQKRIIRRTKGVVSALSRKSGRDHVQSFLQKAKRWDKFFDAFAFLTLVLVRSSACACLRACIRLSCMCSGSTCDPSWLRTCPPFSRISKSFKYVNTLGAKRRANVLQSHQQRVDNWKDQRSFWS